MLCLLAGYKPWIDDWTGVKSPSPYDVVIIGFQIRIVWGPSSSVGGLRLKINIDN